MHDAYRSCLKAIAAHLPDAPYMPEQRGLVVSLFFLPRARSASDVQAVLNFVNDIVVSATVIIITSSIVVIISKREYENV